MTILFLILFWISTIGYMLCLKYKFNLKDEILLGLSYIGITLLIFAFGILNLLSLGSYLIFIVGIFLFFKMVKENASKVISSIKKPNVNMIIVFILILYVTLAFYNSHLIHYDNFSHWGTLAKSILLNNSFPNFESTAIEFKAYQPGTACFIYYFARWFDFSEGIMIVAQNYLFVGLFSAILAFVKGKYRILFRILFILAFIYSFTFNILPFDLLVDSILSVVFIYIFCIFLLYYKNDILLFRLLLPCVLFLCLVKNCGFILAFFVCLINLLIYIIRKNFFLGLKNSIKLGISCLILLLIWSAHVKYGYGSLGLTSHHALTKDNILFHLEELGMTNIIKFSKLYLAKFLSLKNNFSNIVILIVNVILTLLIISKKNKQDKKFYITILLFIDLIYLLYYIALFFMYICSLSLEELLRLACFDRYMLTVSLALSILFIMCFIYKEYNNTNRGFVYIFSIMICSLLICSILFYKERDFGLSNSFEVLLGNNNYNETNSYLFDKYLQNKYINLNNNDPYYIYYPNYKPDSGYLYYLSRYKTNHGNITIVKSVNNIKWYNDNSIIIVLKEDKDIIKFAKDNSFCEKDKNVYIKCHN